MGRNLQSLEENSLLTLDANVFGPLDEASEISLGLDVATDSKVTSILLEQGALNLLGCASTTGNNLLALSDFLHLNTEVGKNMKNQSDRDKLPYLSKQISIDNLP